MSVANVINEINLAPSSAADFKAAGVKADVIAESTSATGVTIDGVLVKDGAVTATGDTAAGDNASMGYTATEGLVLTGQGSTSDITLKNDADGTVLTVATGATQIARVGGDKTLMIAVTDATTYTVLAANSGKVHIVPDLTADCVLSLPAAAAGLFYEFWYGGVAADAHDWQFDTGADANFYLGGFVELDASGNTVVAEAPDGDSNSIVNILTPGVGTIVKMYCNGTNWYLSGTVQSDTADAVTWADQS